MNVNVWVDNLHEVNCEHHHHHTTPSKTNCMDHLIEIFQPPSKERESAYMHALVNVHNIVQIGDKHIFYIIIIFTVCLIWWFIKSNHIRKPIQRDYVIL